MNKNTVIKEASQSGIFLFLNHLNTGYNTTAKEILNINTIKKGRKIKKVKTRVANNKLKKKYLSIIFVCIMVKL
jgi:hypothetical protein